MLAALLLALDLMPGTGQSIAVDECAVLAMIERDDGSSRRLAYQLLSKEDALPPAIVEALVDCLPSEATPPEIGRPYKGPPTGPNEVTDLLVKHGRDTRLVLERRLADRDPDVRRYAAFCLGEICDARSATALLRQMHIEVALVRLDGLEVGISDGFDLAVFLAVTTACVKVSPIEAVDLLMSWFEEAPHSERNLAVEWTLSKVVRRPPSSVESTLPKYWEGGNRVAWTQWWRSARATVPGGGVFRVEPCSP